MRGIALIAAAFGTISSASPYPDPVSSFHCDANGGVSTKNVKVVADAYGWRSVSIIEAALAGDIGRLAKMVAGDAHFTLFQGDVGNGPGSTGPRAAIEFVRMVRPVRFQFATGSGPFSTDACSTSVDVTLDQRDPPTAALATFKYRHGMLVDVTASEVDVLQGDFSSKRDR